MLRAAAGVASGRSCPAQFTPDGRYPVAISYGVSRLARDGCRHPQFDSQGRRGSQAIRRCDFGLQPRQRGPLRYSAMARAAGGQQLPPRALRYRQASRSRRPLHLLELSDHRISRPQLSRFRLLQRLPPSRGGLSPLLDASDGGDRRASADAQRNRDGYHSRG